MQKGDKQKLPRILTLQDALEFIRDTKSELLCMKSVEDEAFHRLERYPSGIQESLHHALIEIPRNLAYVLHQNPAYISPAVEAFYLRDPIALRPLQSSSASKLLFPPEDFVTTSTTFTKVGYAQLRSQEFPPPKVWTPHVQQRIDSTSHHKRAEMGMKVACGMEMFLSDPQNVDKNSAREMRIILDDLDLRLDHLPSNEDISGWDTRDEDDSWLDINFEVFERELAGKGREDSHTNSGGFGDKNAQVRLREMVAKFEDFLNDDSAGMEGAEFPDDMDNDDDDYETSSSSSERDEIENEEEIEFDEDRFATMMREMMGLAEPKVPERVSHQHNEIVECSSNDEVSSETADEEKEICKVMRDMEAELQDAGALELETRQSGEFRGAVPSRSAEETHNIRTPGRRWLDQGTGVDEHLNIDLNLARNMLESFKSQGGAIGPGGNLMGLMGMRLPRDEDGNSDCTESDKDP